MTDVPSLFPDEAPPPIRTTAPLADRMRPESLDEVVGQTHLLGPGRPLGEAIAGDRIHSIILWGPPGTGKTTLARIIARTTRAHFVAFSAVLSGIKDVKAVMSEAETARHRLGRRTIVFVDEIHRFNRAQQDAFLPRVEAGDITLIGATTENPSFEVNAALLSRSKVYVLNPLSVDDVIALLRRALSDSTRGLGSLDLEAGEDALAAIARYANGDARTALNVLEVAATLAAQVRTVAQSGDHPGGNRITREVLESALGRRILRYDKAGEEHFNLISALHKSLRNSDPDAAIYWLARMLESGEDPMYIARRMVRFASEDVGNADPRALELTIAARDATHFLGMPEASTALAQVVLYLAAAPKSNRVYRAYQAASGDARGDLAEPVPLHLRNAPTRLMRDLDYGKGYQYAHDEPDSVAAMDCLPPALSNRRYYEPSEHGFEARLMSQIERWRSLRERRRQAPRTPEAGS